RAGGGLGSVRGPRRRGRRDEPPAQSPGRHEARHRARRTIGAPKESGMQIGMIGLGRMGANMVRRLVKGGHECVVFDRSAKAVQELTRERAVGAASLAEFVKKLEA